MTNNNENMKVNDEGVEDKVYFYVNAIEKYMIINGHKYDNFDFWGGSPPFLICPIQSRQEIEEELKNATNLRDRT